ncbi:MAG: NAD(P)-dependent oxidoreductase [Chloroflexota bacterium]|nr:NAD(P)-dependent oxidoreductase [Chloroflexota bacterium]
MSANEDEFSVYKRDIPSNIKVTWVNSNSSLDEQCLQIKNAVALIAPSYPIPTQLIEAAKHLKLVQVTGAGTDRMNLTELKNAGIDVANHGGGKADAVAEHTIALILSVYRKLHLLFRSVESGNWGRDIPRDLPYESREIAGKTIGIIGLGHIGKQLAQRLLGWKCNVVYSDVSPATPKIEKELNIVRETLDELLRKSDIVVILVPLTPKNTKLIGKRELNLMKSSAILVNTCRGPVVDEKELVFALENNTITGAGLDVTDPEPPLPNNPLLNMDNVVLTPHRSSAVPEAGKKAQRFAIQNAIRVAEGCEPQSIVPVDY